LFFFNFCDEGCLSLFQIGGFQSSDPFVQHDFL
jgi:hypothetical protein